MNRIDLLREWKGQVDDYTLRLTGAVPEALADFRPSPKQFTCLELIRHLADDDWGMSGDLIRNLNLVDDRPKLNWGKSVLESREVLKETLRFSDTVLRTLSEDDLDKPVDIPGLNITVTVVRIVKAMIEHQLHHRGQLITYLRLNDLDFPLRWEE